MSRHEQLPYTPSLQQNQSPKLQSLKLQRNHNKHKCTTTASILQFQFVKPSLLCSALQTPPKKEKEKELSMCVLSLSLSLNQSRGVASTILHEVTLLFYSFKGMILIHGRKKIPSIASKPTTKIVLSSCGNLGESKGDREAHNATCTRNFGST